MAQGTRGRLALLGTGLLTCIGCMEPDPKPISKPPVAKSQMGSTVKPNQPGGTGTTYGGGIQPASFNSPSRAVPTSGSMAPTVPGQVGTGNSFAPPTGVVPPTTPPGSAGSAFPAAPTQPPNGYDAFPPIAPGAAGSAFPAPPTAPPGAVNPYSK